MNLSERMYKEIEGLVSQLEKSLQSNIQMFEVMGNRMPNYLHQELAQTRKEIVEILKIYPQFHTKHFYGHYNNCLICGEEKGK